MDSKLRGKIINTLRRLTYSYAPKNDAMNKQKVAPATFKCQDCEGIIYKGAAKEVPVKILEKFPETVKGKVVSDHIIPVIPISGFPDTEWDWNIYINNLFCDESNFQTLCSECHKTKTYLETQLRKEYRNKKKLT